MRITSDGQIWKVIEIAYADSIRDYALLCIGVDDGNRDQLRTISIGMGNPAVIAEPELRIEPTAPMPDLGSPHIVAGMMRMNRSSGADPAVFTDELAKTFAAIPGQPDPTTVALERQVTERAHLERHCQLLEIALGEAIERIGHWARGTHQRHGGAAAQAEHDLKRCGELEKLIRRPVTRPPT